MGFPVQSLNNICLWYAGLPLVHHFDKLQFSANQNTIRVGATLWASPWPEGSSTRWELEHVNKPLVDGAGLA